MAGRGRGKVAIAAFPEVRHQLRRPKEELLAVNGSTTTNSSVDGTPQKTTDDTPDSEDLKKLCFRLKYLLSSSDSDFPKTIGAVKVAVKTKNDARSASEYMHELSQLGADQAKITALAFVALADWEIEGSKFRKFLLDKMQADFEGFKEKSNRRQMYYCAMPRSSVRCTAGTCSVVLL
ncbi:uncharacterized protein LOC135385956 [Ornithodoros turicata]|uniref:uncharacterized protein LOC135385956 n=1 Tax=Ornithodoros turicata TaxID=34597 RepID=UPI003139DD45